jgi:hypothetical protein
MDDLVKKESFGVFGFFYLRGESNMRTTLRRKYNPIIILSLMLSGLLSLITSCGGGGGGGGGVPSAPPVLYSDINTTSGFSTAYLTGKTFYQPFQMGEQKYIYVYEFTSSTITRSDNLYNQGGTFNYTIVNANGINGVIAFNDGVYNSYINIQSVMSDHIMVCLGIVSVKACTIDEAVPWYFDRASADAS